MDMLPPQPYEWYEKHQLPSHGFRSTVTCLVQWPGTLRSVVDHILYSMCISHIVLLSKKIRIQSPVVIYIYIPGPSFGVWLEVPNSGGLGRNQPGDPDMKVLVYYEIFVECEEKPSFG